MPQNGGLQIVEANRLPQLFLPPQRLSHKYISSTTHIEQRNHCRKSINNNSLLVKTLVPMGPTTGTGTSTRKGKGKEKGSKSTARKGKGSKRTTRRGITVTLKPAGITCTPEKSRTQSVITPITEEHRARYARQAECRKKLEEPQKEKENAVISPLTEKHKIIYAERAQRQKEQEALQRKFGLMGAPTKKLHQTYISRELRFTREQVDHSTASAKEVHNSTDSAKEVDKSTASARAIDESTAESAAKQVDIAADQVDIAAKSVAQQVDIIFPLYPKVGSRSDREMGRPFHDFIHTQPTWIQNFQVCRSHAARNKKEKNRQLMSVCTELLQSFFNSGSCRSVTILGKGKDKVVFSKTEGSFLGQLSKCQDAFPNLERELYQRIRLHSQYYNKSTARTQSFFALGKGQWQSCHTFTRGTSVSLSEAEKKSLAKFTSDGKQFCLDRLEADEMEHGSMSRKRSNEMERGSMSRKRSKPNKKFQDMSVSRNKQKRNQMLRQYQLLVEVDEACQAAGLSSLRTEWEQVFSVTCSSSGSKIPCAACRACRQRFAQAVFVVVAAAGVSDENILAPLGAVFRSQYYRHFSIEEWAMTPLEEIVQIYRVCSKQVQNACYTKLIFRELAERPLPTTLEQLTCLKGIEKKSACLLLQAALGIHAGIPVDRHLMRAGKALGWIPESCKNSDNALASSYLEDIIPSSDFAKVNNVVAGLGQRATKSTQYKQRVLEISEGKSRNHFEVTKLIFQSVS